MTKPLTNRQPVTSPYMHSIEAAAYLLMSPHTLKGHRVTGTGPRFRKHGGRVVYHIDDLDRWSERRSIGSDR